MVVPLAADEGIVSPTSPKKMISDRIVGGEQIVVLRAVDPLDTHEGVALRVAAEAEALSRGQVDVNAGGGVSIGGPIKAGAAVKVVGAGTAAEVVITAHAKKLVTATVPVDVVVATVGQDQVVVVGAPYLLGIVRPPFEVDRHGHISACQPAWPAQIGPIH